MEGGDWEERTMVRGMGGFSLLSARTNDSHVPPWLAGFFLGFGFSVLGMEPNTC